MSEERCANCAAQLTNPDGSSRVVGVEIWGAYDGILFWTCPDCGHGWPRVFGMPERDELSEREVLIYNKTRKRA